MTTIYRVTYRNYYGVKPNECHDHTVGYYSTLAKAEDTVRELLGEGAMLSEDFYYFTVWSTRRDKHTEYLIDKIEVL